ncbi:MAG: glycosyltransferase family 4 protein [Planctomycetota bacterium]|jgi:glycosyltransferase involved in cell wall biosynthesis
MLRIRNDSRKVAFISSYLPRKCGIATFSSDLINSVGRAGGQDFDPVVIAMQSDVELKYEKPVRLKIRKNIKYDYLAAADYINFSDIDLVSVQHEFGLFGGEAGSYLNLLLKELNKPVITTLHTVLEKPSPEYFNSLTDACSASQTVVVMNKRGIRMLRKVYGVPEDKIRLIPHGMPDLPFAESDRYKRSLGLADRKTILTFGLLGRNKGIEVMLRALPAIVNADPSVLYIVLGATHPEVLRREGQSYKCELERMVRASGLQKNVVFYNRFVDDRELFQFLCAADVYVTPYLRKEQLTSGTLAFAVGTGRAVVSTPYWAAQELLARGRGRLVRFGNADHMARAVIEVLSNKSLFSTMKRLAYEYGRSMTWPKVGRKYWKIFQTHVPSPAIPLRLTVESQAGKTAIYAGHQLYQPA